MSRQRGGQASPPGESILLTWAPKIAEAITSIPLYIRTPIHYITPHGSVSSLLTISPKTAQAVRSSQVKRYPSDPSAPIMILNPLGWYVLLSPIYPNQHTLLFLIYTLPYIRPASSLYTYIYIPYLIPSFNTYPYPLIIPPPLNSHKPPTRLYTPLQAHSL